MFLDTEHMETSDCCTHKPFKYYQERLATFDTWSEQIIPDKYQLAKTGFYYTGFSDKVSCFSCNIEIYKWEKTDYPWVEHYKHSPSCDFLKILGYTSSDDIINTCYTTGSQAVEKVTNTAILKSSSSSGNNIFGLQPTSSAELGNSSFSLQPASSFQFGNNPFRLKASSESNNFPCNSQPCSGFQWPPMNRK